MTRNQFITIFFIGLLIFVIYQIFRILAPFQNAFFWAAVFAFGFYPLYHRLKLALGSKETLAALIMTAAIILVVVPPLVLLTISLTKQAIELSQFTYDYIRQGNIEKLIEQVRSTPWVHKVESRVTAWEPLKENLNTYALNASKHLGNFAAGQVGSFTKNIFFIILNLFFMLFMLFFFLRDGEKIYDFIYRISPLEEQNKKSIFGQINDTMSAVLRGQLLTSLAQGLILGVVFWCLGLPLPILFGAVTFLVALIPVAGAATIWVPFVIYLGLTHHYQKAVILAVLGVFVISLADNIIKPALIGEKTKLPYFLLFFGILGGIKVYGLLGIFLAPVILSLFFALAKIYQEKEW